MRYLERSGTVVCALSLACGLLGFVLCAVQLPRPDSLLVALRDPGVASLVLWAAWSALSARIVVLLRGRAPAHAVGAATVLALLSVATTLAGLPVASVSFAAFLFSLLLGAELCGAAASLVLGGVSLAAHAGMLGLLGRPLLAQAYSVAGLLLLGLSWSARRDAQYWRRQSELFDQARWAASAFVRTNLKMQDSVDRIASATQTEDRLWMSRELHDNMGYTLTAALAQVVACHKVIEARTEEAPDLIRRLRGIEEMLRDTLQDMRRRVSALRDGAALADNGARRWTRLCHGFADSTGIRVQANIPLELAEVSEEVSDAVYRVIQESLTNAYRHGNADLVDVSIAWEPERERVLLRVSDNGRGAPSDLSPGNGLSGMRERVKRLDGDFVWQSAPGRGFSIGVAIPWGGGTG